LVLWLHPLPPSSLLYQPSKNSINNGAVVEPSNLALPFKATQKNDRDQWMGGNRSQCSVRTPKARKINPSVRGEGSIWLRQLKVDNKSMPKNF
jgi:hypothetical protein